VIGGSTAFQVIFAWKNGEDRASFVDRPAQGRESDG